eukprot:CAMPEP_0198125948 /NCGR_PEP_ID=MMETSP1442-20131203/43673_1 /TAXON_ID= /ORGANISM="Craspedostauros australis, Strain CCMP3328" /LENGTH=91 /DNA_ID=CAMNT_0043785633 /DNA_START=182 /DNA_END=457 /DNA_ORIENTATION=+
MRGGGNSLSLSLHSLVGASPSSSFPYSSVDSLTIPLISLASFWARDSVLSFELADAVTFFFGAAFRAGGAGFAFSFGAGLLPASLPLPAIV